VYKTIVARTRRAQSRLDVDLDLLARAVENQGQPMSDTRTPQSCESGRSDRGRTRRLRDEISAVDPNSADLRHDGWRSRALKHPMVP
jgi:hypothetical protein